MRKTNLILIFVGIFILVQPLLWSHNKNKNRNRQGYYRDNDNYYNRNRKGYKQGNSVIKNLLNNLFNNNNSNQLSQQGYYQNNDNFASNYNQPNQQGYYQNNDNFYSNDFASSLPGSSDLSSSDSTSSLPSSNDLSSSDFAPNNDFASTDDWANDNWGNTDDWANNDLLNSDWTNNSFATNDLSTNQAILISLGASPQEVSSKEQAAVLKQRIQETTKNGRTYYSGNFGVPAVATAFSGSGRNGPIYGYIAFAKDATKVVGFYVAKQAETPGRGGLIAEPWFRKQLKGEFLQNNAIKVNSGGNGDLNKTNAYIDGISGATRTNNAIQSILNTYIAYFMKDWK